MAAHQHDYRGGSRSSDRYPVDRTRPDRFAPRQWGGSYRESEWRPSHQGGADHDRQASHGHRDEHDRQDSPSYRGQDSRRGGNRDGRERQSHRGQDRGWRGGRGEPRRKRERIETPRLEDPFPQTFRISGWAGLVHDELRALMERHGVRETEGEEGIGFLLLEFDMYTSRLDKRCSMLPVCVKTVLSDTKTAITSKDHLYDNMQARFPELTQRCMAATQPLSSVTSVEPGSVQIVRPVGSMACSGRGITVVTNAAELEEARRAVKAFRSGIISRYFPQPPEMPLLWQGRKFHLRMYLLVRPAAPPRAPFHAEVWTRGKILTAAEPYRAEDWQNKRVHDTHAKTTPNNLWFPEDLPCVDDRQLIYDNVSSVLAAVAQIIQPLAAPYPESPCAYEVFGCDFLVGTDNRVLLLEINDRVGFRDLTDRAVPNDHPLTRQYYRDGQYTYRDYSRDFYSWVYRVAIQPLLGSTPFQDPIRAFGIDINKPLLDPLSTQPTSAVESQIGVGGEVGVEIEGATSPLPTVDEDAASV